MSKDHGYSLTELDNMIPWEREVYVGLLMNYLEELRQAKEAARNG